MQRTSRIRRSLDSLHALVDSSARPWNVSPRVARACFWGPVVGTVLVLMSVAHRRTFLFLLDEDGLAEWLQFFLFCLAIVSGVRIARLLRKSGEHLYAAAFAFFAFAMFFCAGEEISWGQRLLGIETPPALDELNDQHEITVHNIGMALNVLRFSMFSAGLFGTVAWLVNRRLRVERMIPRADVLLIPPLFLCTTFAVMFGYRSVRYAVPALKGFTITHLAEWPELCLAFGIASFSFLIAQRLTQNVFAESTADAVTASFAADFAPVSAVVPVPENPGGPPST